MVMNSCNSVSIGVVLLLLLLVVVVYVSKTGGGENFQSRVPYYTSTFQAYPGKYMEFGSNRNHYCLQQHQEYPGYRNCMLYLE